jgi:hypothetical protein
MEATLSNAIKKHLKITPFDINRDGGSEWLIECHGFYLGSLHRYTHYRNAEGARLGMVVDRQAPKAWEILPCDDLLDSSKLEEDDEILFHLGQFLKQLKVEAHVGAKGATAVKKWIKAEICCFLGGYNFKVSEDVHLDGESIRTYEGGGSATSQVNNYFVEFQGYLFKVPVEAICSDEDMYDTFTTWQKTGMDRYTVPGEWSGLAKGFCVDSEGALKIDEAPEGEPERRIVLARCEDGRSTVEAAWLKWKKHEIIGKAISNVMGEFAEHLPKALSKILKEEKKAEVDEKRSLFQVGDFVRFEKEYDIYPKGSIKAGTTGVISEVEGEFTSLVLDEPDERFKDSAIFFDAELGDHASDYVIQLAPSVVGIVEVSNAV